MWGLGIEKEPGANSPATANAISLRLNNLNALEAIQTKTVEGTVFADA